MTALDVLGALAGLGIWLTACVLLLAEFVQGWRAR